MKTRQVTIREGELLGPIDWDFDFREFYKDVYPAACNGAATHERMFLRAMTILRELDNEHEKYEATVYGGQPRCGWGNIVHIGMYDGWPYWKPIPSVQLSTMFGGEWHGFHNITDIRLKGEHWPLKIPEGLNRVVIEITALPKEDKF